MKVVSAVLCLLSLSIPLFADSSCLSPIDGWQVFNYQSSSPTPTTFVGGWEVRRIDVPADPHDDGDWDKFQVGVSNGKAELKQGCCYPGTPFFLGHFGKNPGKLAMMSVTNVRNGIGLVEWELDVVELTSKGITVTTSANLVWGGKDSVFTGRGHELGYLKTDVKAEPSGGDWFSGRIYWLKNGKFVEDDTKGSRPKRRLYEKFYKEVGADMAEGVIGMPFKWLRAQNYWCKYGD